MPPLDDMAAAGDILWKCQQCQRMGPVNVQSVRTAMGGAYDLTDKTAPCRTPGCEYWVTFYARDGMRLRALVTPAFQMQLSDRRTRWLAERRARLHIPPSTWKAAGMKYENPLPEGLAEPEETAVRLKALEALIRMIMVDWPDDRLKAEAEYLARRRIGPPGTYVAEDNVLGCRGAEVASEIVWDVWLAKQAAEERQMMKDGTHPLAGPPEPAD